LSAKVYVVISGKGGVGKTITTAALGAELANQNYKVVLIDFDIGLRNLDLIMGCERRVIYDFINVLKAEATLSQALIQDKRQENLFILPASQTRNKDSLSREGIGEIIAQLKTGFDFIICDAPPGIEKGAIEALYYAEEAIIVTTPDIASVRGAERIIGILNSENKLSLSHQKISKHLVVTRVISDHTQPGKTLTIQAIQEILDLKVIGVIPESPLVQEAAHQGKPVTLHTSSNAKDAYIKCANILLGKVKQIEPEAPNKWNFFKKIIKKQPNYEIG